MTTTAEPLHEDRFFLVTGTIYYGTLRKCSCGNLCVENQVTLKEHGGTPTNVLDLSEMPREMVHDDEEGDDVCEDCLHDRRHGAGM